MKTLNIIFEPKENFNTVKNHAVDRESKNKNNRIEVRAKSKGKFINSHTHARAKAAETTLHTHTHLKKKLTHVWVHTPCSYLELTQTNVHVQREREKYASAKTPQKRSRLFSRTNVKNHVNRLSKLVKFL